MAGIVRLNDSSTSHGDFPSSKAVSGSPNVFINGKPVIRVGDPFEEHCDSDGICHNGKASSGSSKVFANGKPICRIGDSIDCGSIMNGGSSNVFAE